MKKRARLCHSRLAILALVVSLIPSLEANPEESLSKIERAEVSGDARGMSELPLELVVQNPFVEGVDASVLSEDGSRLVTRNGELVQVWRLEDKVLIKEIILPDEITAVLPAGNGVNAFSRLAMHPDGKRIALITRPEFYLQLKSVNRISDLPKSGGSSLVIVARVGGKLHIRIFDASGRKFIDRAEPDLIRGAELASLKEFLRADPFPSLRPYETEGIINKALICAGHTEQGIIVIDLETKDIRRATTSLAFVEVAVEKGDRPREPTTVPIPPRRQLAYSADGDYIYARCTVSGQAERIRLADLTTANCDQAEVDSVFARQTLVQCRSTFNSERCLKSVSLGDIKAEVSGSGFRLLRGGREIGTLGKFCASLFLSKSSDGRFLATGNLSEMSGDEWYCEIRVWDLEREKMIAFTERDDGLYGLAFIPDSHRLLMTGREGVAVLDLSVTRHVLRPILKGSDFVFGPGIFAKSGRLLRGDQLWNLNNLSLTREFGGDEEATVSSDGSLVRAGNHIYDLDGTRIDPASLQSPPRWRHALAKREGFFRWEQLPISLRDSMQRDLLSRFGPYSTPDALYLAPIAGTGDLAAIRCYDLENGFHGAEVDLHDPTGKHLRIIEEKTARGGYYELNRSPDLPIISFLQSDSHFSRDNQHRAVASATDPQLFIYNAKTKHELRLLSTSAEPSQWILFSPDGYFAASEHGGGLVRVTRGLDSFPISQFASRFNRPDGNYSGPIGADELFP